MSQIIQHILKFISSLKKANINLNFKQIILLLDKHFGNTFKFINNFT